MESSRLTALRSFAERYTAAWCSHDPARVAACYSPSGSLTINGGVPSVGRDALSEAAREFMTTFPDLRVIMDDVIDNGDRVIYKWTLEGTNTGPGGSGKKVRISGFEEWQMNAEGLIAESQGHFDAEDYQHQLEHGFSS
jgi:uncharacterized protein (TIGR02246 family)